MRCRGRVIILKRALILDSQPIDNVESLKAKIPEMVRHFPKFVPLPHRVDVLEQEMLNNTEKFVKIDHETKISSEKIEVLNKIVHRQWNLSKLKNKLHDRETELDGTKNKKTRHQLKQEIEKLENQIRELETDLDARITALTCSNEAKKDSAQNRRNPPGSGGAGASSGPSTSGMISTQVQTAATGIQQQVANGNNTQNTRNATNQEKLNTSLDVMRFYRDQVLKAADVFVLGFSHYNGLAHAIANELYIAMPPSGEYVAFFLEKNKQELLIIARHIPGKKSHHIDGLIVTAKQYKNLCEIIHDQIQQGFEKHYSNSVAKVKSDVVYLKKNCDPQVQLLELSRQAIKNRNKWYAYSLSQYKEQCQEVLKDVVENKNNVQQWQKFVQKNPIGYRGYMAQRREFFWQQIQQQKLRNIQEIEKEKLFPEKQQPIHRTRKELSPLISILLGYNAIAKQMEIISDIQRKQTAARHDEQEHYIAPRQQYHMRTMSIFDVIPVTAAVFGNVVDSNFYNQPKSITTDASTITAPCQTNDSDNEHRKVSLTQDPSNSVISLPAAIAEQPSYAQNYHTFFDNGIDILPRIKQCEALLDSISLSSYSQEIEALRKENEERYMACERLFDKADDTWSISSQLEINRKDGIFVM